ncbi:hypothetical protein [Mesorhizobium sp.]|uniref:hypothetical protein n=1 Tax=Mesorhizobium sp. TaxID=1871066 RepID=UPI00257C69E3|nr:hypothetical protein [Mesorhizobium sp.]
MTALVRSLATRAIGQAEVGAMRTMIDKTKERFGLKPRVPGRRQRLRIDFKPLANGSS